MPTFTNGSTTSASIASDPAVNGTVDLANDGSSDNASCTKASMGRSSDITYGPMAISVACAGLRGVGGAAAANPR